MTATLARDRAVAPGTSRVQEVVSGCGVRALLITERSVPFLSLALYARGGAATDPTGLSGAAYMAAGLLDEGAGPYDSKGFRQELEDHAIRLSFDVDRDGFSGDLKTLTQNREHAFELLRLAVCEPRFDEEPVERIRSQILVEIRRRETEPDYLASRAWFQAAFGDHAYGRPTRGAADSIAAIPTDTLREVARRQLTRNELLVGVAGDIEADELAALLDRTFGELPAEAELEATAAVAPQVGDTNVTRLAIPQSVVIFGHAGIARHDPDYYAAYTVNHILGGGGFSSRLMEEVREKRGLAYGVSSQLYDLEASPLWLGSVATSNERVAQSLSLVRSEVARMAVGEIEPADLADAKTYLTGSFPLRLTTNDQTAKMLVNMLVHELGTDFLERRNEHIEAVDLDAARRTANRLFTGELLVSVVGSPEGL